MEMVIEIPVGKSYSAKYKIIAGEKMAEEIWIPDTRPILLRYEERKKNRYKKNYRLLYSHIQDLFWSNIKIVELGAQKWRKKF